jgi:hypothetical protein
MTQQCLHTEGKEEYIPLYRSCIHNGALCKAGACGTFPVEKSFSRRDNSRKSKSLPCWSIFSLHKSDGALPARLEKKPLKYQQVTAPRDLPLSIGTTTSHSHSL